MCFIIGFPLPHSHMVSSFCPCSLGDGCCLCDKCVAGYSDVDGTIFWTDLHSSAMFIVSRVLSIPRDSGFLSRPTDRDAHLPAASHHISPSTPLPTHTPHPPLPGRIRADEEGRTARSCRSDRISWQSSATEQPNRGRQNQNHGRGEDRPNPRQTSTPPHRAAHPTTIDQRGSRHARSAIGGRWDGARTAPVAVHLLTDPRRGSQSRPVNDCIFSANEPNMLVVRTVISQVSVAALV